VEIPVSPEFPVYLTTGRVVSQYLSGQQTRRIGGSSSSIQIRGWKSIRALLSNTR